MLDHVIREANVNDLDKGLLEVYIDGYRHHQNGRPDVFSNLSDEELKENLINDFDRVKFIVIINDDKIVGHLSYEIKEKRGRKKFYIDELVVKKEFRSQGLGKELLNEGMKIAKEEGCNKLELNCWLFNEDALRFYDSYGFERQRIIYDFKI